MSTQALQLRLVLEQRMTKKQEIENFFCEHLGKHFRSNEMHFQFGSAFRSRVSDINKDKNSQIVICNEVEVGSDGKEYSTYYSAVRTVAQ